MSINKKVYVYTTFHNVIITIEAHSIQEAYCKLCKCLGGNDIEFSTDTYTAESNADKTEVSDLYSSMVGK